MDPLRQQKMQEMMIEQLLLQEQNSPYDILTSTPDTESYLQKTQNVISSLQAKLQNAKSSPLANVDFNQLNSKLPVSQLSRSNSLNYRLYRKTNSAENSPLRNPGNYLITGTYGLSSSNRLMLSSLGASRSLDTDPNTSPNKPDYYSPILTNKYIRTSEEILSRLRMERYAYSPSRHHSFDDRNDRDDFHNANMTQSLNLKSSTKNALFDENEDRKIKVNGPIDQTARKVFSPSNHLRLQNIKYGHQRGSSDKTANLSQSVNVKTLNTQSSPIRRSSSFNIVNKNNNLSCSPRISSAGRARKEIDCFSEDSDNISTGGFYSDYDRKNLLVGARCNRAFALRRARLESPDARSPKCPATPEMKRKFANEQAKKSRDSRSRISDARPDVCQVQVQVQTQKSKKTTEIAKQRLTRSSSAAKDFLPKNNKKPAPKVIQNPPAKEVEFSNWKKRSSYDPIKAVQESKKKTAGKCKLNDLHPSIKIDEVNSPSNSSPVHRSKSFNCTGTPIDERLYLLQQIENEESSDMDDFEDRLICTLPAEGSATAPILKMVSASDVDSDIAMKISNAPDVTKRTKQLVQNNYIKLPPDFIAKLQMSQGIDPKKAMLIDKRKTYLINPDQQQLILNSLTEADKRRTFILDSDTTTNSTTNGSGSRRNSSIYSDEKVNNEERLSDSDAGSDTEPIVNVVPRVKSKSVPPQQRHSGDFSMSSSSCSASKDTPTANKKNIQPRYLDISKYKNESSANKNFLRRDPTKTYVNVLPTQDHRQTKKNTPKQIEQEQKNRELEKWKRRASYDPRKAAAQGKQKPVSNKSPSNSVLRSQSFHGPMMQNTKLAIIPFEKSTAETFYQDISSDNEF